MTIGLEGIAGLPVFAYDDFLDSQIDRCVRKAEIKMIEGDMESARDILIRALRFDHRDPELRSELGTAYMLLGNPDKAKENLEMALENDHCNLLNDREKLGAYLNLTLVNVDLGDMAAAEAAFAEAGEIVIDDPVITSNKAVCAMFLDNYYAAEVYFKASIEQLEEDTPAIDCAKVHYDYGNSLLDLKRYEEAIEQLLIGFEYDPEKNVLFKIASANVSLGNFDEAFVFFLRDLGYDPDNATAEQQSQAYGNMGLICLDKYIYDKGEEFLTASIAYNPVDTAHLLAVRGFLHNETEQYEKALVDITESLELDKEKVYEVHGEDVVHYNLGVVHKMLGNYLEAEKNLLQAIEVAEEEDDDMYIHKVHVELGFIYSAMEEHSNAVNAFVDSIEMHPTLSAYFGLAQVMYLMDDEVQAVGVFEQGIRLFHKLPSTYLSEDDWDAAIGIENFLNEINGEKDYFPIRDLAITAGVVKPRDLGLTPETPDPRMLH